MTLRVAALNIYPLKGARAAGLEAAAVEARGLAGDRRLVATDPDGAFLTQRGCGALARISIDLHDGRVRLKSADLADICEAPLPTDGERRTVVVWRDAVSALAVGAAADDWLSRALGRPARLYQMDEAAVRMTSTRFAPTAAPVSFADAYPVLVTTSASLAALNAEIARNGGAPVGMQRFRPNLVIDGADPWAEDFWATIAIGDVVLDLVKPCDRCAVTTTDQRTGVVAGKEPLASLARLRRSADPRINGVLFGWNAIPRRLGAVNAGDEVRVTASREARWALA